MEASRARQVVLASVAALASVVFSVTRLDAQAIDSAAVLAAAAKYYLTPRAGHPVVEPLTVLSAADSASLEAARAVFAAAGLGAPGVRDPSPPCSPPLPPPPNDTSPRGYAFSFAIVRAGRDSAIVDASLRCRYDRRPFGQGEQLLLRRGRTGWKVERSLGEWIT